jgi:hypothetical protein
VRLDQADSLLNCVRRHQADLFIFALREHDEPIDPALRRIANASTCALMGISRKFEFRKIAGVLNGI